MLIKLGNFSAIYPTTKNVDFTLYFENKSNKIDVVFVTRSSYFSHSENGRSQKKSEWDLQCMTLEEQALPIKTGQKK